MNAITIATSIANPFLDERGNGEWTDADRRRHLQLVIDEIEQPEEIDCGNYFAHLLDSAELAAERNQGALCIHYIRCAIGEAQHHGDIDAIDWTIGNCEEKLGFTLDLDADVDEPTIDDVNAIWG